MIIILGILFMNNWCYFECVISIFGDKEFCYLICIEIMLFVVCYLSIDLLYE